jgi:hypothetical protein
MVRLVYARGRRSKHQGIEPRKRAHFPQLAAGLRAYLKKVNFLTVEDSLSRRVGTAGIFKKAGLPGNKSHSKSDLVRQGHGVALL